jgi:hypothetical protein
MSARLRPRTNKPRMCHAGLGVKAGLRAVYDDEVPSLLIEASLPDNGSPPRGSTSFRRCRPRVIPPRGGRRRPGWLPELPLSERCYIGVDARRRWRRVRGLGARQIAQVARVHQLVREDTDLAIGGVAGSPQDLERDLLADLAVRHDDAHRGPDPA